MLVLSRMRYKLRDERVCAAHVGGEELEVVVGGDGGAPPSQPRIVRLLLPRPALLHFTELGLGTKQTSLEASTPRCPQCATGTNSY